MFSHLKFLKSCSFPGPHSITFSVSKRSWLGYAPGSAKEGVEESPGSGKKGAAGREDAEQAGDPTALGSVSGPHHRPQLPPAASSRFLAWGAGEMGVSLVAGGKEVD